MGRIVTIATITHAATRSAPRTPAGSRAPRATPPSAYHRQAPHQLRDAHAIELAREGVPLNVIQRQLGHRNLGVTSIYLQGIDPDEIIQTVHGRPPPMIPASVGPALPRRRRSPFTDIRDEPQIHNGALLLPERSTARDFDLKVRRHFPSARDRAALSRAVDRAPRARPTVAGRLDERCPR